MVAGGNGVGCDHTVTEPNLHLTLPGPKLATVLQYMDSKADSLFKTFGRLFLPVLLQQKIAKIKWIDNVYKNYIEMAQLKTMH